MENEINYTTDLVSNTFNRIQALRATKGISLDIDNAYLQCQRILLDESNKLCQKLNDELDAKVKAVLVR